jgi:hypothetical protein
VNVERCSFVVDGLRFLSRPPNPVAANDTLGTWQGRAVDAPIAKLLANDSDVDGNPLTFVSASPSSQNGGTVSVAGEVITYVPPGNFLGTDTFQYTAADRFGGTATGHVYVKVLGEAPSLNFLSIVQTAQGIVLQFAGIPGQRYLVQAADQVTGPWVNVAAPITAEPSGLIQWEDQQTPLPSVRFYRTQALP